MKPRIKFNGTVEKGKLKLNSPEAFNRYIFTLEGPVTLEIKKVKQGRSLNQNSYYWGVVVPILASDLGYEVEEMHEALKWKFLRVNDKELPTVRSTAKLSKGEFVEYIDRIIRWAATEYQIIIPLPNEAYTLTK